MLLYLFNFISVSKVFYPDCFYFSFKFYLIFLFFSYLKKTQIIKKKKTINKSFLQTFLSLFSAFISVELFFHVIFQKYDTNIAIKYFLFTLLQKSCLFYTHPEQSILFDHIYYLNWQHDKTQPASDSVCCWLWVWACLSKLLSSKTLKTHKDSF